MLWTIVGLFAVAVFLLLRRAKPASDKISNSELLPPIKYVENDTLQVASYNVQTGKNLQGRRDIKPQADLIRSNDLVGVQEVYAQGWLHRLGIGHSQAKILAAPGQFAALYAATRRRWGREHRGNLLLSKIPLEHWKITMLPDQSGKSYRNMTIARFIWKGETIHIINTHLHTGKGRQQQLEVVMHEFLQYPRAILVGDFNMQVDWDNPALAKHRHEIEDAIQTSSIEAEEEQRIDWIMLRGVKTIEGTRADKGLSDHPYYSVEIRLEP